MTVTKESEGRLNAFAKEPKIQLIETKPSSSKGSRIVFIFGGFLLAGLIALAFTIK